MKHVLSSRIWAVKGDPAINTTVVPSEIVHCCRWSRLAMQCTGHDRGTVAV